MICLRLCTDRLELVAATPELIREEMNDHSRLCYCLNAHVPGSWPPKLIGNMLGPIFADRLEECPRLIGWSYWYWILKNDETGQGCLIGRSYFNEPTCDGTVEIGYEVLTEFRDVGYATEAVRTLVAWAFSHSKIIRVIADAYPAASIRVLEKNGFTVSCERLRSNMIRFELTRSRFAELYPKDYLVQRVRNERSRDTKARQWWKRWFRFFGMS